MNLPSSNLPTTQNGVTLGVEGFIFKIIYQVQMTNDEGVPSEEPADFRWLYEPSDVMTFIIERSVGLSAPTNFIVEEISVG